MTHEYHWRPMRGSLWFGNSACLERSRVPNGSFSAGKRARFLRPETVGFPVYRRRLLRDAARRLFVRVKGSGKFLGWRWAVASNMSIFFDVFINFVLFMLFIWFCNFWDDEWDLSQAMSFSVQTETANLLRSQGYAWRVDRHWDMYQWCMLTALSHWCFEPMMSLHSMWRGSSSWMGWTTASRRYSRIWVN